MTLTVGSLFSGIGGLELGLEAAGMKVKWQVEKDEYCRRVLAKHWPTVPRFEDIHDVGKKNLAYVDAICGGFPCQDISNAGRRAGIVKGVTRSGLWGEFERVVRELRPRFVIVENVSALLVRGIDVVCADLAAIGYDAVWDCVPASYVGAPHRRDRVWIVGYARGESFHWMQHRSGEPRGRSVAPAEPVDADDSNRRPAARDQSPAVADADSDHVQPERVAGGIPRASGILETAEGLPQLGAAGDRGEDVADSDSERRGIEQQQPSGEGARARDESRGSREGGTTATDVLADAEREGLEGYPGHGGDRSGRAQPAGSVGAGRLPRGAEDVADSPGVAQQEKHEGDDSEREQRATQRRGEFVTAGTGAGGGDRRRGLAEGDAGGGEVDPSDSRDGADVVADASSSGRGQSAERAPRQLGFAERVGSARGRYAGTSNWQTEPDVGRVADGVPARVDRLRGLGNAVVPQNAEFIGWQLREAIGDV